MHCHVKKSAQVIGLTVGLPLVDTDGLLVTSIEALTLGEGKTDEESVAIIEREGDIVAAVGEATSDCEASFEGNDDKVGDSVAAVRVGTSEGDRFQEELGLSEA